MWRFASMRKWRHLSQPLMSQKRWRVQGTLVNSMIMIFNRITGQSRKKKLLKWNSNHVWKSDWHFLLSSKGQKIINRLMQPVTAKPQQVVFMWVVWVLSIHSGWHPLQAMILDHDCGLRHLPQTGNSSLRYIVYPCIRLFYNSKAYNRSIVLDLQFACSQ